jgi:hypothetical protein
MSSVPVSVRSRNRVQVQEDVREDRERLVLPRVRIAVAEERTPDRALLEAVPDLQRDIEHRSQSPLSL